MNVKYEKVLIWRNFRLLGRDFIVWFDVGGFILDSRIFYLGLILFCGKI